MDFFEAQARAKKRTSRLVVLFVLAVLGTVAAGYFSAVALIGTQSAGGRAESWWDPLILASVSLGTVTIVGCASVYKWSQLRQGGKAVAALVGGRQIDARTTDTRQRRLLNVVEEMAIASGVPMPTVFVLPDETGINAFAAGLTASDAVVAVTQGALDTLTRDELQGVIAHEFSHILNGDMRLNVKLTAIVFGILVIGMVGRGLLFSLRHTRSRGKNQGGVLAAIVGAGLVMLLLGYVGYFFGRLIQAAVSRQREYLADASAVQFTRNPQGIGNALRKIGGLQAGSLLRSPEGPQFGHFFFAQGFRASLAGLWATHPPLSARIQALDAHNPATALAATGAPAPARPSATQPPALPAAQDAAATAVPLRLVPQTVIQAIGTPDQTHVAAARALLADLPPSLHAATQTPASAVAVVYGLLIGTEATVRADQFAVIRRWAGDAAAGDVAALHEPLTRLAPAGRLPLVFLALPALQTLPSEELTCFLGTLDKLIHSDGKVSVFEFALRQVLTHHLALGKHPSPSPAPVSSFPAVAAEIACVLSALAKAASPDTGAAKRALAAGVAQLPMLPALAELAADIREPTDFGPLAQALDRLANTSLPIRQRLLAASVHVILTDGEAQIGEVELLRAFASVLDCPMPVLVA